MPWSTAQGEPTDLRTTRPCGRSAVPGIAARRPSDTQDVDPLSSPIVEALKLRPVQPVNTNLAVLLRDGLVVAGEVLSTGPGTAFLSLGGRRVAAETDVELEPGQRFLARVEREAESIVLRLLRQGGGEELPLVAALRAALADHAPAGTLLTRLAAALRAALLLSTTADAEPPVARDASTLLALPDGRAPRAGRPDADTVRTLQALLARLTAHAGAPTAEGSALQSALARSGLFHEALLLRGDATAAREDLKSVFLRALDELPPGPERESVRRALGGLEAEQLLDVARAQSGDARQISLALPDGAAWADVQLVVDPDQHGAAEDDGGGERKASAVDVAVELSMLGPVRAELRLEDGALRVRVLVASTATAQRLAQDQESLAGELARDLDASRAPQVSIVVAEERSIAPAAQPADVRFLGEHALLDRTA